MAEFNEFSQLQKEYGNTGYKELVENKLGVLRTVILAPNGVIDIADADKALTKATWDTLFKALKSQRAYILPMWDSIEDLSGEDTFNETLNGPKFGQYGPAQFRVMMDINTHLEKNLRGFDGKDLDGILIDESASMQGISKDGTKFQGISMRVRVGKRMIAAQGERAKVPVTFTINSVFDLINYPVVLEPLYADNPFNPLTDFDGVYDVDLSLVSASIGEVVIDVHKKSVDTSLTSSAVSGLVVGDFVHSDDGITGVTESDSIPGRYIVEGAFVNDETINLVACSAISLTTIAIESTGAVTITGIV